MEVSKLRSNTCIVGLIEKEVVYIGGDSAATYNGSLSQRLLASWKVKALDDEMVIGCCGSLRAKQLLFYGFDRPIQHERNAEEYIITTFMDAVRTRFAEGGHMDVFEPDKFDGAFMIGYH